MCGLLGYFFDKSYYYNLDNFNSDLLLLNKRGPDNYNYYINKTENISLYLGHTRLSILELSNLANQPFKDNNHVLIFNGEIYNHMNLRIKINNTNNIKSNSDTETLFYLLKNNNIENVLKKIDGMFAICFYDKIKNKLFLARDRSGEKPLYIYLSKNCFGFTSDIATFKNNKNNNLSINTDSLGDYMNLQYIPAPKTIYKDCFKLPPGSLLEIDLNKFKFKDSISFQSLINQEGVNFTKYWNLEFKKQIYRNKNYTEVKNTTEELIKKSVKKQMLSDVPIGAFLSSGVDSSLIVSMMQKLKGNTETFTIGYKSNKLNEAIEAKQISNFLGTKHNEFIFNSSDLIDLVEEVPYAYSEPFADSSQIPTMMISKLASQTVKVILSGDGGDEVFGGYNRYIIANRYWKFYKYFPKNIKNIILKLIKFAPINFLNIFLRNFTNNNNLYKSLNKLKSINNENDYYYSMVNEWSDVNKILNTNNNTYNKKLISLEKNMPFEKKMMLQDFNTYLPDDILCKVDRASMYYSLETRSPFLDHEILNYCFSINNKFIFNRNSGKHLLKDILSAYIPRNLISKKKKGFAVPISEWLNHELLEWSNDYLTEDMCKKHNFFNYQEVEKIKKERNETISSNYNKIWTIVQFNKWYSEFF